MSDDGSTVARLAWLAGTWVGDGDGWCATEHWLVPAGGAMVGVNHTVSGDRTASVEHLLIEDALDDAVRLRIHLPRTARDEEMMSTVLDDDRVEWADDGDGGTRLEYAHVEGRLRVTLEKDGPDGERRSREMWFDRSGTQSQVRTIIT